MHPTSSERHLMRSKGKLASRLCSVLQGKGAWGWEESFGHLPEFQTGHHISNVFMPVAPWHPLPPSPTTGKQCPDGEAEGYYRTLAGASPRPCNLKHVSGPGPARPPTSLLPEARGHLNKETVCWSARRGKDWGKGCGGGGGLGHVPRQGT